MQNMTGHDPDTNAYIFEILKVTKMFVWSHYV